jgi:predicted O-linked N-acetylglucosamine transferase (SPINDLY family)
MGYADYLRSFNDVDVSLDTTPYSGGTTTCDALWMGVPVITVPGTRSISRSTTSILATLGLSDWIATSPEDYVRLAVRCTEDRESIAELRRTLRGRMRASPLVDELQFARDVEDAYRRMWRTWCGSAAK